MAKKKVEELNYYEQQSKNEFSFREMLKRVKPDLYVMFDILETTGVNWLVVMKVIRAINNLATGNGYGNVTITMENGKVTFIRGEESDRVNEMAIIKREIEPKT